MIARKLLPLLALLAFASIASHAQIRSKDIVYQTGAPTGTCFEKVVIDRVTGYGYTCVAGVWTLAAAGSGISGLTAGTIPQAASSTSLSNSVITQASSMIGIGLGTVAPPTAFAVGDTSSSTPRGLMSWQASSDTSSAHLHMRKSRGTFGSPTTIVTGDLLGRIVFSGYEGSAYNESAYIRAVSTGTIAGTRVPSQLEFFTSTNAAPSVATLALTIGSDQKATFAGTVVMPTPFTLGATSVTSTGTQLNYLNAATGTTGTTSTNLVFSTSPVLITPTLGVASSTSDSIGGTGGAGFLQLLNQSSAPSTPTSAARLFVDNSNRLSWIGTNGFTRTFDGTANTANRIYVLPDAASNFPVYPFTITYAGVTAARTVTYPDANFTVARTDAGQTFTGVQAFTSPSVTTGIDFAAGGSLLNDAANTFTFRNGTNAQRFNVANTFTSTSNREDLSIYNSSNVGHIGMTTTGGTARALQLDYGGTTTSAISVPATSGNVVFGTGLAIGSTNLSSSTVSSGGDVSATATGYLYWASRLDMRASASGILLLQNQSDTDFSRIQLGGTTSSFPAIKRNSAAINFRLADDSADAAITSAGITASGAITTSSTTDSTTTTSGALQVAGGAAIRKRVFIDGITASSGLQTAVLCQSSGGEMIADSVACLASSARFKNRIKPLNSGLNEILSLRPVSFFYKPEGIFATNQNFQRERVGLIAEEVAKIDPRLVGFEKDNITPRTVGYEQIVPVLIKAVQEQQKEIEILKQQIEGMKTFPKLHKHAIVRKRFHPRHK